MPFCYYFFAYLYTHVTRVCVLVFHYRELIRRETKRRVFLRAAPKCHYYGFGVLVWILRPPLEEGASSYVDWERKKNVSRAHEHVKANSPSALRTKSSNKPRLRLQKYRVPVHATMSETARRSRTTFSCVRMQKIAFRNNICSLGHAPFPRSGV